MSLVKVVLENGSSNGESVKFVEAKNKASDNLNYTLSEINSDPLAVFTTVLSKEAPRYCSTSAQEYNAGSTWPQSCGLSWDYQSTSNLNEYVTITGYSETSRDLSILSVVKSNGITLEYRATVRLGSTTSFGLYSASNLDISLLDNNSSFTNLSTNFYSAGSILNWDSISTTKSYFFSESGFNPQPSASSEESGFLGRKFATNKIDRTKHIYPLRNLMPNILDNTNYRANFSKVLNFACRSQSGVNVQVNGESYLSKFCLSPGEEMVTTSGSTVTVPNSVSFIVLPEGNNLAVYYPSGDLYDPVANCTSCSISDLITDQYNPNRDGGPLPPNPGFLSSYAKLGTFNYPLNNIVTSASDLIVGFCDSGFLTSGCSSNGASHKSKFKHGLSFIAGSLNSPKDIFIGQGLESSLGRISLIASDQILIPYWASSPGGSLVVSANIFTFSGTKSISTLPISTSGIGQEASQILYILGGFYSSDFAINIDGNLFSSYKLEPTSSDLSIGAPYPFMKWELLYLNRVLPSST